MMNITATLKTDLKVGDMVFIREDLERGEIYGDYMYMDDMCKGVQKIKSIHKDCENFKVFSSFDYFYTPEMIDWDKTMHLRYAEELAGVFDDDNDTKDNVNNPSHYKLDGLGIEVNDVIRAVLGSEMYKGWTFGNAIKYILRHQKKNGVEDLKKAIVNIEWLIDEMENDSEEDMESDLFEQRYKVQKL